MKNNGFFLKGIRAIFAAIFLFTGIQEAQAWSRRPPSRPAAKVVNKAPIAAFSVSPGSSSGAPFQVTLNADASKDEDGRIVQYKWTLNGRNAGTFRSSKPWYRWRRGWWRWYKQYYHPSIKISQVGENTISLTVKDDKGRIGSATRKIALKNQRPVAMAESSTKNGKPIFLVGDEITLDGSKSYDPDSNGSVTKYDWEVKLLDAKGKTIEKKNLSGVKPTLTGSTAGMYSIFLTVTDNLGQESPSNPLFLAVSPKTDQRPIVFVHGKSTETKQKDGFVDEIIEGFWFNMIGKLEQATRDGVFNADLSLKRNLKNCGLAYERGLLSPDKAFTPWDQVGSLSKDCLFAAAFYRASPGEKAGSTAGHIGSGNFLSVQGDYHTHNGVARVSYGQRLAAIVSRILEKTTADQVDMVAHSMGGLVARAYVNWYDEPNGEGTSVNKLITVGTPNHGVPTELIDMIKHEDLAWMRTGELLELSKAKAFEGNRSFAELINDTRNANVRYGTIAGDYNVWDGVETVKHIQHDSWDGLVQVVDVNLESAEFNMIQHGAHGKFNYKEKIGGLERLLAMLFLRIDPAWFVKDIQVDAFSIADSECTKGAILSWLIEDKVRKNGSFDATSTAGFYDNGNGKLAFESQADENAVCYQVEFHNGLFSQNRFVDDYHITKSGLQKLFWNLDETNEYSDDVQVRAFDMNGYIYRQNHRK